MINLFLDCTVHVLNKTSKLCQVAMKRDGMTLAHLTSLQTEELCLTAMNQNINSFKFVIKQTNKLCFTLIERDPNLLRLVDCQFEELFFFYLMKQLTIKQNNFLSILKSINNKFKTVQFYFKVFKLITKDIYFFNDLSSEHDENLFKIKCLDYLINSSLKQEGIDEEEMLL